MKLPFATAAEFVTRYRENVTRGGVYLRAKKVLPPGTLVNLDLKLTNGERLIHGSAVVHFVTGQNGSGPSGLGIKFLGLDEASKKFIDEMLAGHPAAFTDTPPMPAGVGEVQYADKAQTDTAVTRVMPIPAENLFAGEPIPMPAPPGSAPWTPPASGPPPFETPLGDTPDATPPEGLPFATPEAPPRPVEVTSFPPPIDSALLDRLEVDPSDPRAVLGMRPAALPDEAGAAAARMKADLHLDSPGDPITTRLRRMLAHRLDAAVEALVRPAAKDSPALAAARSLVDGDPQAAYEAGTNSVDPQAKALAFVAACAVASQTRKAEWIDKANLLAKDGASATFLGSPWILLAQSAYAAGDTTELKRALAEVAKQDPASPFVPKAAPGKSGSSMMAIVLLVVGLAGGFAGGLFGGPMLGLTGRGEPVKMAKTEPPKTEPAKTEPAKTEPAETEPATTATAEPAKTEPAAAEPAKTEPTNTEPGTTVAAVDPTKTEPVKTEPATTVAAADPKKTKPPKTEPAKTEPVKTEHVKTEPATPKLSPAEEKAIVEREAEFLKNVEEAMGNNEPCMPAMVDLGDIAATSPRPAHIGQAIILRARCFDASSKPAQARAEYKKYTRWFPKGPYIDEARDSN